MSPSSDARRGPVKPRRTGDTESAGGRRRRAESDRALDRLLARAELPDDAVVRRVLPFFVTWSRWQEPAVRRILFAWLALVASVVPLGMLTRLFEWTGIPVRVGGSEIYLTVYLPLVACVPLTFWMGLAWAAIPAYLSTLLVALLGGMPVGWSVVFAFANPVGLAVIALSYRSLPVRIDLRSASSALFFVLVMFVSSLAGSSGAFVWALTNRVGFHDIYPVWQGWWLGGLLQAVLFTAPLLVFVTPIVERRKRESVLRPIREEIPSRSVLIGAPLVIATGLSVYVVIVRAFTRERLEVLLRRVGDPGLAEGLANAFDAMVLPQYVLLFFALFTAVFGIRVGTAWAASLRGAAEHFRDLNQQLEERNRELARLATTDVLTGVANRARLLHVLESEISASRRHSRPLSCVLLDADRFKSINDRFGHLAGDEVLRELARRIRSLVRAEDLVARFGGEEFAVLLPSTGGRGARDVAEKIRRGIADEPVDFEGRRIDVTVSLGVAVLRSDMQTADALLAEADTRLYEAKNAGRNRVHVAEEPEGGTPPGH